MMVGDGPSLTNGRYSGPANPPLYRSGWKFFNFAIHGVDFSASTSRHTDSFVVFDYLDSHVDVVPLLS